MTRLLLLSLTLLLFQNATHVAAQEKPDWIEQNLNPLLELYVHFHQHPELSFHEKETAARLAKELGDAGCEVTTDVGGHGVVAILKNGDGPTVMIRTDLDGLPIIEQTELPYASQAKTLNKEGIEVGVMHACGHDVHITNLIGTARYMAAHKQQWRGTLMFIGQPAEEKGAGAKAMLADGLFERFPKPDFAIALHCNANLASGKVSLRSGPAMANVDSVDVTIHGRGGHGAYPHSTIDPIVIAAKLVTDLQTIVSREISPTEPAVVTVGSIHAGTKHNIIADECVLQLTVRSFTDDVRKQLRDAITRKANAAAASAGADQPTITFSDGTPSLSNDPQLYQRIHKVLVATLGAENVDAADRTMGGEDFSRYGRAGVPILMYLVGAVEPRELEYFHAQQMSPPSLHSSKFAPDIERTLETGLRTMTASVLSLLPADVGKER